MNYDNLKAYVQSMPRHTLEAFAIDLYWTLYVELESAGLIEYKHILPFSRPELLAIRQYNNLPFLSLHGEKLTAKQQQQLIHALGRSNLFYVIAQLFGRYNNIETDERKEIIMSLLADDRMCDCQPVWCEYA